MREKKDLLKIMTSMLQNLGIQVLMFDKKYLGIEKIDYGFRKRMFSGYSYQGYIDSIATRMLPGILYHMEDEFGLYYSVFRFPELQETEYHVHMICIGPMLLHPITADSIQNFLKKHQIPNKYHSDFHEFYTWIPTYPYGDFWNSTLQFFLSGICGRDIQIQIIPDLKVELTELSYVDYFIPQNSEITVESVEYRYDLEDHLLEAVSSGNFNEAIRIHSFFTKHRLFPQTTDEIRDRKNLLINFNTLLRKTIQKAGIHPMHAENLSMRTITRIESCDSQKALDFVSSDMIKNYCALINSYSRSRYSYLVQTCMNYIEFHYSSKLALNTIADACFVSTTYLATIFKKETGTTLTTYINNIRIQQAKILLNSTNLPIQEIAARCGITDSNYFSRLFRKYCGQTPREYRNILRQKKNAAAGGDDWSPL